MPNLAELALRVQALEPGVFWLLTGMTAGLCLVGIGVTASMFKRARLIEDMPTSKIRSAAQGHVELEGIATLLPGEPVIAPLSRARCAWWQYSIEKKNTSTSSGGNNNGWKTLESARSDDLFQLVDDTGACVVDPEGATVMPNVQLTWYGHSRQPPSAPAKSRLLGSGNYRFKEQRIEAGSPLYALGWFRTEGGIAHSFDERSEVRDLLASWKQDQARLLAEFDTNGDGAIDMDEWAAVRAKAIEQVRQAQLERVVDPDIHVLCRPPRRLSFLLSTLDQGKLRRDARAYTVLGLGLFFAGGSVAIWLATARGLI